MAVRKTIRLRVTIALLALLTILLIAATRIRPETMIDFEHISGGIPYGAFSGWQRPCYVVLWDMEAWEYIWNIHCRVSPDNPPVPVIDFDNYMVIALFRGSCERYGYWIEVQSVTYSRWTDTVTIHYWMNTYMASGEPTFTQPYHIVQIPKTFAKICFLRDRKM